ncbi:zinc finger protein 287-like [Cololabis saira]|uniref:zinc finger protein 287-like n=1 Tax=Cololabis saira TaxID=129043 RepID=UPI002AD24110|nr:zinc finger protein 287-like [Cololabis saira]
MSANMAVSSLNMESQLLSIMNVTVKAAVSEIIQLFSDSSDTLRLHLSQSLRENETLRMRMKGMRSELFSLRLQTRTSRPASRFSPLRGNFPKPRAKSQVLIKPLVTEKAAAEVSSITLQPESKTSSSATETKPEDVESPDVILIKDEDDVGCCEPAVGQDNFGNGVCAGTQELDTADTSCSTDDNRELRIISVHGGGEVPLQEESATLFTAAELQVFSSLSDHNITPDGLLNFTAGTNDTAAIRLIHDNGSQLERNHSTQMASTTLNTALKSPVISTNGQVGLPSHISQFPQQQSVFSQSVNKSLDCSFCGKHFLSREELIVHRASHTGESPVTCPTCGKSFVNKTTLNIHMRIHTGEKPYACEQCGKRFTQNGSLKIHLRTHSGEKPYTCNQCNASFNNPSNLRRHMITHNTNDML